MPSGAVELRSAALEVAGCATTGTLPFPVNVLILHREGKMKKNMQNEVLSEIRKPDSTLVSMSIFFSPL